MRFTLEPPTPFDRSLLWRIHDAYFAQRGVKAWRGGDIPYFSTSNYSFAAQHAALCAAHADDLVARGRLAPDAPLWILEGGCGAGAFAANFVRAFAALSPGHAARLRYVLSDYSEKNVREALRQPALAAAHAEGRLVPALYDLRQPGVLRPLDGAPAPGPLAAVVNNYICCVVPAKHLQKAKDGVWSELLVELRAEVDDPADASAEALLAGVARDATRANLMRDLEMHYSWRVVDLDRLLGEAHREALGRAVAGFTEATVSWPYAYLDFTVGVAPLLAPGAVILTNDYGSDDPRRLEGASQWRPQLYGNTLNQDVNTSLLEAFFRVQGWDVLRTDDPLASVHAVVTSAEPLGARVRAAFAERYQPVTASDHLLDCSAAARTFTLAKEHARATRLLQACVALDPHNPEHRYRAGEAAIDAGQYRLAIDALAAGHALDHDHLWDFEFQLGRAHTLIGDAAQALLWYERSLTREDHPVTHCNVGILHAQAGRHRLAHAAFQRALALDPEHARAKERLATLQADVWREVTARFERGEDVL